MSDELVSQSQSEGLDLGAAHRSEHSSEKWILGTLEAANLVGAGGPPNDSMTRLTTWADVDEGFRSKGLVQGGGGQRDGAPITLHSLISLSGTEHFERRRLEAPLFKKEALRSYEREVLIPATKRVLERCAAERSPDGVVRADLLSLSRQIFVQGSARVVGLDGIVSADAARRLLAYAERISAATSVEWSRRDHGDVVREALDAKRKFVEEYFVPSWARRESLVDEWKAGRLEEDALPSDLLTLMIRAQDHFSVWDHDVFVREACLFMIGGSIGGLPRIILNAVGHIADWIESSPTEARRVSEAEFLADAVDETLRLHPGSPKIRRALRDVVMGSGRRVKAGDFVLLDIAAANRDPDVFGTDANTFRPGRKPRRGPAYGFAFGGGPHTCIGKALAIGEFGAGNAKGALATVLGELYRAGVAPDSRGGPQRREDTVADQYSGFIVRFDLI